LCLCGFFNHKGTKGHKEQFIDIVQYSVVFGLVLREFNFISTSFFYKTTSVAHKVPTIATSLPHFKSRYHRNKVMRLKKRASVATEVVSSENDVKMRLMLTLQKRNRIHAKPSQIYQSPLVKAKIVEIPV